jgi:2-polyprenyl-3-methyl-5-hydroxy-6-metoxy-1,4-benzoquinol methylase
VSRQHFNPWKPSFSNPSLLSLLGELRAQLRGCETVLDVGCGGSSPLRYLGGFKLVGVDGYAPAVEEAKLRRTHDEVVHADVLKLGLLLKGLKFEACVALDLIEHLKKEDGYRLLDDLEHLATRKVIISTPNGFLPQKSHGGDLQEHLSGWNTQEMRQRGYEVIGMTARNLYAANTIESGGNRASSGC